MKFTCDNCQAKYQIGDDKIAGRSVRMKCRKCGHMIHLHAGDPGAGHPVESASSIGISVASLLGGHEESVDDESATRVMSAEAQAAAAAAKLPQDDWYAGIGGTPLGPVPLATLREKASAGSLTDHSLVWREGFDAWKPLREMPELRAALGMPSQRLSAPPPPTPKPAVAQPAAAPSPRVPDPASAHAVQAAPAAAPAPVAPSPAVRPGVLAPKPTSPTAPKPLGSSALGATSAHSPAVARPLPGAARATSAGLVAKPPPSTGHVPLRPGLSSTSGTHPAANVPQPHEDASAAAAAPPATTAPRAPIAPRAPLAPPVAPKPAAVARPFATTGARPVAPLAGAIRPSATPHPRPSTAAAPVPTPAAEPTPAARPSADVAAPAPQPSDSGLASTVVSPTAPASSPVRPLKPSEAEHAPDLASAPAWPVTGAALPVQEAALRVPESALPVREVALPVREVALPVREVAVPVREVAVPVREVAVPVREVALPVREAVLPVPEAPIAAAVASPAAAPVVAIMADPFALPPPVAVPAATSTARNELSPESEAPVSLMEARLARKRGMHPLAYALIAMAAAFGGVAAYILLSKPPQPQIVVVQPPPTLQPSAGPASTEGPAPSNVPAIDPTADSSSGTGRPGPIGKVVDPKGTAQPAPSGSLDSGGTVPVVPPPATDTPPPITSQLSEGEIRSVVTSNQGRVKKRCWQPALESAQVGGPTSARVSGRLTIGPSGNVESASASGGEKDFPGLSSCVASQMRTWKFPASGGTTPVNVPFFFAGQ